MENFPISWKLFILITKITDLSLEVFDKQFGISFTIYHIFAVLNDCPDITQRELATQVNVSDAAISKQMTKLSERGLLNVQVNPNNNRHKQISLTDKSIQILKDCTQVLDQLVKEHLDKAGIEMSQFEGQLINLLASISQ